MMSIRIRIQSAVELIKNAVGSKESHVWLELENKKLVMQLVSGKEVSFGEAMLYL